MQGTSVHPDFNDVSSLAVAHVPFKALCGVPLKKWSMF